MSQSILLEAEGLVNGPRQHDYGHPLDNYDLLARYMSLLLGIEVSAEQAALTMILGKIAREQHRPKRDNRVDIAGYSMVLDMIVTERERRMEKK